MRTIAYMLSIVLILAALMCNLVAFSYASEGLSPLRSRLPQAPRIIIKVTTHYFWFDIYW